MTWIPDTTHGLEGRHILKHEKIDGWTWQNIGTDWHFCQSCCLRHEGKICKTHTPLTKASSLQRSSSKSNSRLLLHNMNLHCNSAYIALENIIEQKKKKKKSNHVAKKNCIISHHDVGMHCHRCNNYPRSGARSRSSTSDPSSTTTETSPTRRRIYYYCTNRRIFEYVSNKSNQTG